MAKVHRLFDLVFVPDLRNSLFRGIVIQSVQDSHTLGPYKHEVQRICEGLRGFKGTFYSRMSSFNSPKSSPFEIFEAFMVKRKKRCELERKKNQTSIFYKHRAYGAEAKTCTGPHVPSFLSSQKTK
ncbi:unnamed protein product [Lepeophtheirus salmonis]|uniref:(salmon louse) hypothetical protein n=1 Tax=Lepeophtheirus salmonis TaxID=72036 RepID=A0A7R8CSF6_LEPSM|nr:unnamed protein product [Lepeophtheirus salmonis]CAF2914354.1 unnamed protein product [Lepeophtheirus salmonis]